MSPRPRKPTFLQEAAEVSERPGEGLRGVIVRRVDPGDEPEEARRPPGLAMSCSRPWRAGWNASC